MSRRTRTWNSGSRASARTWTNASPRIKGEIKALDTKFNVLGVGMALALAYLAVLASLDRFL